MSARAGTPAYDRLVVDLGGQGTTFGSYDVRYVPVVLSEGQGSPLPVRGDADLQIALKAPAYDQRRHRRRSRRQHRDEVVDLAGYTAFRQVALGRLVRGLHDHGPRRPRPAALPGRSPLPGTATDGPRMVIDVAHRW